MFGGKFVVWKYQVKPEFFAIIVKEYVHIRFISLFTNFEYRFRDHTDVVQVVIDRQSIESTQPKDEFDVIRSSYIPNTIMLEVVESRLLWNVKNKFGSE